MENVNVVKASMIIGKEAKANTKKAADSFFSSKTPISKDVAEVKQEAMNKIKNSETADIFIPKNIENNNAKQAEEMFVPKNIENAGNTKNEKNIDKKIDYKA